VLANTLHDLEFEEEEDDYDEKKRSKLIFLGVEGFL